MNLYYQEKLIAKTASLYYIKNLNQKQISNVLHVSQATVSRLLDKAIKNKIVKVSVKSISGSFTNLEEEMCSKFNLTDCVISKSSSKNNHLLHSYLGEAAAFHLETIINSKDIIGISSWSETLLNAINAMHPLKNLIDIKVVQTLGGIGDSSATEHAVHLLSRFTELINAEKFYLPISGIVSKNFDFSALNDKHIEIVLSLFNQISLALVGVGSIDVFSPLIKKSGNILPKEEINRLINKGAVGDVGLQFFDISGKKINISEKYKVIGMTLEQLKKANNVIVVAGGIHKVKAIIGALNTSVINTLITDPNTAKEIIKYVK